MKLTQIQSFEFLINQSSQQVEIVAVVASAAVGVHVLCFFLYFL